MKLKFTALFLLFVVFGISSSVFAHCQIPCGIYGDKMRFDMWMEQIATIEKSMNQINELSRAETPNYNQIVRWVNNKDKHADDIMEIALQYFLAQRIKPGKDNYAEQLKNVHLIIIHAMKAKQTTDLEHVQKLRDLVKSFHKLYFNEEMKPHPEEHSH